MTAQALQPSRRVTLKHLAHLLCLAIVALVGTLWIRAQVGGTPISLVHCAGFALAFFAARALPLRLPQGDRVQLILVVGLVGIVLRGVEELLVASVLAGALDVLLGARQSLPGDARMEAVDVARSTLVIAMVAPWQVFLSSGLASSMTSDSLLAVVVIIGAAYAFVDVLTLAIQEWVSGGASVPDGIVLLVRPLASVYLVHIAMAAVVVRVYPSLGFWGFGIALLLTFILQNSFNLYLRIRRAYSQTIGALAHAAELDRPDDAGHAQRVATAAFAVGRQMGMSSLELERIGYAALLHDIGRIGGERLEDDEEHPLRGAAIVSKVPFLDGVAPLIAQHREIHASDVPRGAAVVGVCCRFDRLTARHGVDGALEVLESEETRLRSSAVAALKRAVRRHPYDLPTEETTS